MKRILFIIISLLGIKAGWAAIELSNPSPKVGENITIIADTEFDSLIVQYRPNSAVVKTEFLVNNPPASQINWTPQNPGVASLSYTDKNQESMPTVSRNVSIRFEGLSISGIVVMLLAGTLLFGGAITAFRTLFRDEAEDGTIDLDPDHLPDT